MSHMFVEALGLPARHEPWGVAGDVLETERSHIEMRLTCDGPVAIKGKGMFTVWRLGGWPHPEPWVHASVGAALGDSPVQKDPADGGNDLFELLVHRQEEIKDEGSMLARQMLTMAAEYRRTSSSEPWGPPGSFDQTSSLRALCTALYDMLVCLHALKVNACPRVYLRCSMLTCMPNHKNRDHKRDDGCTLECMCVCDTVPALCMCVFVYRCGQPTSSDISCDSERRTCCQHS